MNNLPEIKKSADVGFQQEEIDLLKKTIFKDLSDNEIKLSLKMFQAKGLNPFLKEGYAINLKGRFVTMDGIAGVRKIANKSGKYLGCKISVKMDAKTIVSATATVKKLVSGHIAEYEFEAIFSEFNKGRDEWLKQPVNMIRKCAEMNALKMAFHYELEQLEENATDAAVNMLEEPIPVDDHPVDIEHESQEVLPPVKITPGDYFIKFKSMSQPAQIKDIHREQLQQFLDWAVVQENMPPKLKEDLAHVAAFLEVDI